MSIRKSIRDIVQKSAVTPFILSDPIPTLGLEAEMHSMHLKTRARRITIDERMNLLQRVELVVEGIKDPQAYAVTKAKVACIEWLIECLVEADLDEKGKPVKVFSGADRDFLFTYKGSFAQHVGNYCRDYNGWGLLEVELGEDPAKNSNATPKLYSSLGAFGNGVEAGQTSNEQSPPSNSNSSESGSELSPNSTSTKSSDGSDS